jgi:hypothetical protein
MVSFITRKGCFMLVFSCYHCGLITDLEDNMAGKTWQCPACRQSVTIPANRTVGREGSSRGWAASIILVLTGLLPGLAVGGWWGHMLGKRQAAQGTGNQPLSQPKQKYQRLPSSYVDATDWYDEYKASEIDCDRAYKGKVVEVSGVVGERNEGRSGDAFIRLLYGRDGRDPAVKCIFDPDRSSDVTQTQPGKQVRVRGVCRMWGVKDGIVMYQCELIE